MAATLYSLHVPSGFGGGPGSDVNTRHLSPGRAGSYHLDRRWVGLEVEGPGPGAAVSRASLLLSGHHTTLPGAGLGPKLLEQKP